MQLSGGVGALSWSLRLLRLTRLTVISGKKSQSDPPSDGRTITFRYGFHGISFECCWFKSPATRARASSTQDEDYDIRFSRIAIATAVQAGPMRFRYFRRSLSVFRSSTMYDMDARTPWPQRTGARSEISSPLQTGRLREASPIHACSIFTELGTFSTSS